MVGGRVKGGVVGWCGLGEMRVRRVGTTKTQPEPMCQSRLKSAEAGYAVMLAWRTTRAPGIAATSVQMGFCCERPVHSRINMRYTGDGIR